MPTRRICSSGSPIESSTPTRRYRPNADVLARNRLGQAALWPHGISGDLPIVLVRIDEPEDRDIVRQCLRARQYWQSKGVVVDLVILNEKSSSYTEQLQAALEEFVAGSPSSVRPEDGVGAGAVRILRGDRLSPVDRVLLQTAARVVLLSRRGTLVEQVTRAAEPEGCHLRCGFAPAPSRAVADRSAIGRSRSRVFQRPRRLCRRRTGVRRDPRRGPVDAGPVDQRDCQPVLRVSSFGIGRGLHWSGNSRENQLTPWSNDAVGDPPGEILYVRDEETGELWGPTVLPIREDALALHGPPRAGS